MKLDVHGKTAQVTLSRRNLRTLFAKLNGHPAGSARTITKLADGAGEWLLVVTAEEDAEHYGTRGYPAGEMHPATEAAL